MLIISDSENEIASAILRHFKYKKNLIKKIYYTFFHMFLLYYTIKIDGVFPQLMKKVIILVDMDCFYVQVEKKLHPELIGKPCAVIQYKEWQGGRYI